MPSACSKRKNTDYWSSTISEDSIPITAGLSTLIAEGKLGTLISASLQWPTGRLGNVGTHAIDALLMLTGHRIQSVSATLDLAGKPDCRGEAFSDPGGWGVMRMNDGLMVTVSAPGLFRSTAAHGNQRT